MNFTEYQMKAARTIASDYCHDQEMHAVHGMIAEYAEIIECMQDMAEKSNEHLIKEFGDLLWMIAEYCTSQGWNMEDVYGAWEDTGNAPLSDLIVDIGRLNNLYQKSYQGHIQNEIEYKNVIADILHTECSLINCYTTVDECMRINIDKLLARYPNGFDTEHSTHRAEGDI